MLMRVIMMRLSSNIHALIKCSHQKGLVPNGIGGGASPSSPVLFLPTKNCGFLAGGGGGGGFFLAAIAAENIEVAAPETPAFCSGAVAALL